MEISEQSEMSQRSNLEERESLKIYPILYKTENRCSSLLKPANQIFTTNEIFQKIIFPGQSF